MIVAGKWRAAHIDWKDEVIRQPQGVEAELIGFNGYGLPVFWREQAKGDTDFHASSSKQVAGILTHR